MSRFVASVSSLGRGQHLASVLQEGRENANIDAGLGFIWRILAGIVSPLLGSQADAGVGDRKLNPVASVRHLAKGENQRAECGTVACAVWAPMDCNGTDSMSSWGHFAPNSGKPKSTGDVAIRACKTYQLGGVPGRAAVPRWLGLLSAVCRLACITTTFAQSPGSQISIYAVEGLALGAHIPFDSSAYREYKCSPSDQFDGFTWCQQHASRGNGVDRLTSPTRSFTLVTEASFTSTGIKHQLSSVAIKPSTTFSPTHRNSASRPEQRYGWRTNQDLTAFLLRGETLYWNRSIPRIGKHSLKGGVWARDITSILLATLTAPLRKVFRYIVSAEVQDSFGLRVLIRKVAVLSGSWQ